MNLDIDYLQISEDDEVEDLVDSFCRENGEDEDGSIPDSEYDRLFDGLGEMLSKHGTFSSDGGDADFSGSRYADQTSWIQLVPADDAAPSVALKAALESVQSAHRPLAVSFDYYPDILLVMPPNRVLSTFDQTRLTR